MALQKRMDAISLPNGPHREPVGQIVVFAD
jgi:hypothetical protein